MHIFDGIFYIMLHECVHSGVISCIYRKGSMGFVYLYFNCLGSCMVSWGLCYNSIIGNAILILFTISYEIVFITLKMLYCDRHISICIIYLALRHPCRSVSVLAIYLTMLTNSPVILLSLSLISRVQVLF